MKPFKECFYGLLYGFCFCLSPAAKRYDQEQEEECGSHR